MLLSYSTSAFSKYFSKCNGIDAHNQARQGILKLEKRWITHDPWFRLSTTLFGMTVTDCWKAFKYALPERHPLKQLKIVEFADRMAHDLVNNTNSDQRDGGSLLLPPLTINVDHGSSSSVATSAVSPLTQATTMTMEDVRIVHPFIDKNPEIETDKNGRSRPKRRTCSHLNCKKKYHKLCGHDRCRLRPYNVNGSVKHGIFCCADHMVDHWMDVINGRAES